MEQNKRFGIALLLLLVFTSLAFQNAFGIVGDEAISADKEFIEHEAAYKEEAHKILNQDGGEGPSHVRKKRKALLDIPSDAIFLFNQSDNEILLKSRRFTPKPGPDTAIWGRLSAQGIKEDGRRVHFIIQFEALPGPAERKLLKNKGIKLLSYIPNKAWLASADSSEVAQIGTLPNVRWVGEILPEDKMATSVRDKKFTNFTLNLDGTVNLSVMFFGDVPLDKAIQVVSNHGGSVTDSSPFTNVLKVTIPNESIWDLADDDSVMWINQFYEPKVYNDGARAAIGVDEVQSAPYNLDGTGVVVGEWDGGHADSTHDDLEGRVTFGDSASVDDHATHVAGTVLGNGTLSAAKGGTPLQWKGMATNATILSYLWWDNIADLYNDYDAAINTYGIDLSTNSWGYGSSAAYDEGCQAYDNVTRGALGRPISILAAAANDGPGWGTVRTPNMGKNTITVGATNSDDDSLASFSSRGPTDDGRLKPDVVAPGCQVGGDGGIKSTMPGDSYGVMCGTSMSTPATAGSLALLIQDYRSTHSADPLPSTVKAVLINTAKDLGNTGPDYSYGWGRINITAAVDLIREDTESNEVMMEGNISDKDYKLLDVAVPLNQPELKVTLVWDDYPGTPLAAKALVNDIDLEVRAPNSTIYYSWVLNASEPGDPATTGRDDTNNVEQAVINTPVEGIYSVRLNGSSIPESPQTFSIVVSGGRLATSKTGFVSLNSSVYSCSGTVGITLTDADLNANNLTVDNTTVNITSDTETTPEIVNLTETGNNTGTFTGSIGLSTDDSLGTLNVTHDDIINATYYDEDNGTGSPSIAYDTATIDCIPPEITINLPQNITYNTSDVDFDINTSEALDVNAGVLVFNINTSFALPFIPLVSDSSTHWYNYTVPYFENANYNATFQVKDLARNPNSSTVWFRVASPDINVTPTEINETLIQGNATERNVTIGNDGESTLEFNATVSSLVMDYTMSSPSYEWVDGVTGGTDLLLDDDDYSTQPLPFTFSFYSSNYSQIHVSSNGWVTFDNTRQGPDDIPKSMTLPVFGWYEAIFPLGDDWNPGSSGGVYVKNLTLPNRYVITWYQVPLYPFAGNNTFQAVLYENGEIRFNYENVDNPSGFVVGINKGDGTYGTNYGPTPEDDTSLLFTLPQNWLTVTPTNGTVPVAIQTNITAAINSTGLNNGSYSAKIRIDSSDLNETPLYVTVNLNVIDITPPIVTIASPVNGTTYNMSWVDLTYSVNEDTLVVNYRLDGEANVTLTGNTTLKNLSNYEHNLTVYAQDLGGNWNSSTVYFNVMAPNISVSPTEINITMYQGNKTERNITIGNDGLGELKFNLSTKPASNTIAGWTLGGSGDFTNGIEDVMESMNGTYVSSCSGYGSTPTECLWEQTVIINDGHGSTSFVDETIAEANNGKAVIVNRQTFNSAYTTAGNPQNHTLDSYGYSSDYFYAGTGIVVDGDQDDDGYLGCDWEHWTTEEKQDLSKHFDYFYELLNPEWLSISPTNGTVDVGNNTNVTAIINSASVANGSHLGWIRIDNNDLDKNPSYVTVNLNVIDVTPPTLTFISPTPGDGASLSSGTSSVTINVSVEEVGPDTLILNWNGANESHTYSSSNKEITKSVSSGGSYTFYVWANDTAGNSKQTTTISFSVQSGGGDGGTPGGGGGGGGQTADFELSIRELKKGDSFTIGISDADIPYLKGITIKAAQNTYFATLSITDLDKKPAGLGSPEADVYTYFKMKYNKPASYVEKASFKFRVEKSWLESKDINPYEVKGYRYTYGWVALDTEPPEEDDEWIYFQAETPGFSYFSLGGEGGTGYGPPEINKKFHGFSDAAVPKKTEPPGTIPPQPRPITPQPTPIPPKIIDDIEGRKVPGKGICGPTFVMMIAVSSAIFLKRRVRGQI